MEYYWGEIAALLAAAGFSVASVFYTFAGRKVNAITSLAFSLPTSCALLGILHYAEYGTLLPWQATPARWFHLGLSGILAFVLSSWCMLIAYQAIGPRLTMLIANFAPLLGALLAWIFLGQTLPGHAALGIGLVTIGVLWVVAERAPSHSRPAGFDLPRGGLYATLGTIAQAAAFVFSSHGVADGFPPLSATLMRIVAGAVTLWLYILARGMAAPMFRAVRSDRRLLAQLSGAAILGPVVAGYLLLVAFQHTPVGIATTLSHTTAIMLIPVAYFVFREAISARAILGTAIAIAGMAVLFN